MFRHLTLSAKVVQSQWAQRGNAIHSFPTAFAKAVVYGQFTHRFYQLRTMLRTRFVHKYNAAMVSVKKSLSAVSTGLITTTTTFIYKNNRIGAQV